MSRSPTPRQKGADLSPQDYPASSDDESSSIAGDSDQGLEVARSLGHLAIVPYKMDEAPAMNAQLSAELSELEELDDVSADELDMTAASRSAIGLRCASMPTFVEHQALVLQSREADPVPSHHDDPSNCAGEDSQVGLTMSMSVAIHEADMLYELCHNCYSKLELWLCGSSCLCHEALKYPQETVGRLQTPVGYPGFVF